MWSVCPLEQTVKTNLKKTRAPGDVCQTFCTDDYKKCVEKSVLTWSYYRGGNYSREIHRLFVAYMHIILFRQWFKS